MRIDGFQQRLSESREFGVELEMNPGRQPRETLEQPLDVGVGTDFLRVTIQCKTTSNLRVLAREFTRHVAQMAQLGVVEAKESLVHALSLRRWRTRTQGPTTF